MRVSLFLCISSFFLLVQQSLADDRRPIRIGGLVVLTGQYAMQGAAFREGLELAVDEINAGGGVGGSKLELRLEDTANLPTQALTAARKLIAQDHVMAAITTSYPELATGAAEFQKSKVPVVHLWDANSEIEAMGEYIFAIGPWTPSSGEVAARFSRRKLNAKTAVVFHINDPWSELVARYFKEEFEKSGGKVLHSFAFNPQDQDFRSAFARTRLMHPDLIYSPITDNIVSFYTQLKQAKLESSVVSSDVIADEHVKQAPSAFEGVFHAQMRDPEGGEMEKLAAAYRKKFGRDCSLPWFVGTAYDSIKIITRCIKSPETEATEIRDCIARTTDLVGVSSKISFNPGGSSPQFESIFRITDGGFRFEWQE